MKPTVNVLYVPGTNCQEETLRAFSRAGAAPRMRFLQDLLAGTTRLDDADILCIPGGFSFGDHVAAGTITGLTLKTKLADQLKICQQKLMICICNGFQIAMRAGVFGVNVALKQNSCGTFQNVPNQQHKVAPGNTSPWLAGLENTVLEFPCAHAEGRFVYHDNAAWQPALHYPQGTNPDGSMEDIAGITTTNGLVFGLMNHPERVINTEAGLAFFENGVRAAA